MIRREEAKMDDICLDNFPQTAQSLLYSQAACPKYGITALQLETLRNS